MIGTKATIRELFFDRDAVHNAIDDATRAVLSRFGAYTRRTAQQSIRSRKKASAPGQPPSSHTGLLKHNIFFAYDPVQKSVVVGPTYLPGVTASTPEGGGTVPSILETGGTVLRPHYLKPRKHQIGDFGHIRFGGKTNKTRSVRKLSAKYGMPRGTVAARVKLTTQAMVARADRIEEELVQLNLYAYGSQKTAKVKIGPRPFMVPAFQKELGVLDTLWQTASS